MKATTGRAIASQVCAAWLVTLGACGRATQAPVRSATPRDAAPVIARDAEVASDVDVVAIAEELVVAVDPLALGAVGRRVTSPLTGATVAITERTAQAVEDRGTRFELVEERCRDIFVRGGSDCADMGAFSPRWYVRALDPASGAVRWRQALPPALTPSALRVVGDRVRVESGPRCVELRREDGATP